MNRQAFISILCGFGLVFFVLAVWANPYRFDASAPVFDSPDETANYFWTARVARGEPLWYQEPLEEIGNSLIKPRSMNVVGDRVVPGSFFGLPLLYGCIATLLGEWAIPFLTPLFASLAVIAFGLLTAKLFGRGIGLMSAALLAVLTPWWYFTARGMYHNVLFLSLVMIGVSLVMYLSSTVIPAPYAATGQAPAGIQTKKEKRDRFLFIFFSVSPLWSGMTWWVKLLGWGIAGLLIGYAVVVRSSEAEWVFVLVFSIVVYQFFSLWKRESLNTFPWLGWLLFVACGMFALTPLFVTNIELYGAPVAIGYRGGVGQELGEFLRLLPRPEYRNLFFAPFGVDIIQLKRTVKGFLIDFFPWWTWPTTMGAGVVVGAALAGIFRQRKQNINQPLISNDRYIWGVDWKRWSAYLLTCAVISFLLIVYYGSWEFTDRIDGQAVSLNTSFLRYWLPIYVMGVPFISLLVYWFISLFKLKWLRIMVAATAVCVFTYPSAALVLADTDESLMIVRSRMPAAALERRAFVGLVPEDAVVITYPQADKVLFPARRRLITALVNAEDYRAVQRLATEAPVYYYTFATLQEVEAISRREFEPYGMRLTDPQRVFKNRWLWRVARDDTPL